ncbi:MAG TPA: hypothetical protein VLS48_01040 [Anaerolineales bacterium]|nr:hypothetical protein [Anaerolineales bacterium]
MGTVLFYSVISLYCFCPAFPSPVAAAGDEWINVDQQGELFEAPAEFSPCRRSSFRHWEPAQRARHWGVFLCLLSFAQAKKVRRRQGPQPLHPQTLIICLLVAPGRHPTFLARPRKVGKRRPPSIDLKGERKAILKLW